MQNFGNSVKLKAATRANRALVALSSFAEPNAGRRRLSLSLVPVGMKRVHTRRGILKRYVMLALAIYTLLLVITHILVPNSSAARHAAVRGCLGNREALGWHV